MSTVNCQAGIIGPPPEHVLVAALTFTQRDPTNALAGLLKLQEVVRRELAADIDEIDPQSDPLSASVDTGELGVATEYDTTNLTITLGLASTAFAVLGISEVPTDLIPINWDWFADTPQNRNQGDLALQICADSAYVVEHVLRRVEYTLSAWFSVTWTLAGEQRDGGNHGRPLSRGTGRALIGFHDGLSNLDPNDPADQQLIFVGQEGAPAYPPTPEGQQPPIQPSQPGYSPAGSPPPVFPSDLRPAPGPEPDWATGGSYLMVRGSVFDIAAWDQQPLQVQQPSVGRWKYSGATLDNPNIIAHRLDAPLFSATPSNVSVPLTSHIRRANPRGLATDAQRRIFRRGYPLMTPNFQGTLQRGLLFIAFGRSLSTQVEFIMRAWLKNPNFPTANAGIDPLLTLDHAVTGGYYFVLPVATPSQPWKWALPTLP